MQAGSVEEWEEWREAVRVNMRKPLGMDFARRRYWCIGGRAACWRVYVEEEEGGLWGWYEGSGLCKLVEWLRRGGIDREAALMRVLAKAPLPKVYVPQKLKRPGPGRPLLLPYAPTTFTAGEEGAAEAAVDGADLAGRRPDGMKGKLAPLLRGEGNWPDASLQSPLPKRIYCCIDALLADLTFWFKEEADVAKHLALLEAVRLGSTAAAMGQALLAVEEALQLGGCMGEEWDRLWRDTWRTEIAACAHFQQCLLHVAALQEHVVRRKEVMPRQAFERVARDNACQLHFPFPGTEVVLLRSGVLQHLNKHMQDLGLEKPPEVKPAPPSPQPVKQEQVKQEAARSESESRARSTEPGPEIDAAAPSSNQKISTATDPNPPPVPELRPGNAQESAQPMASPPPETASAEAGTEPETSGKPSGDQEASEQEASGSRARDGSVGPPTDQEEEGPKKLGGGVRHLADTQTPESETEEETAAEPAPPATPADRLAPDAVARLREQWAGLRAQVEGLNHVERFSVVSVAYRRNILEGSAAESVSREDDDSETVSNVSRWPVAWLLLRPSQGGPTSAGVRSLFVPLRIDNSLPDYLCSPQTYQDGMLLRWRVGQRFQMFFGGKARSKKGGVYYKGTVTEVAPRPPPEAPPAEQAAYNPWEAIQVEWDPSRGQGSGEELQSVSPWEIERDPDDVDQIRQDRLAKEALAASLAPPPPLPPAPPPVAAVQPSFQAMLQPLLQPPPPAFQPPLQQMPAPAPAAPAPPAKEPTRVSERGRKRRRLVGEEDEEWDPRGGDSPQSSGGGEWKPSKAEKGEKRQKAVYNPSGLSTSAPQEVLDLLQPLGKERFLMLVGNWYRINRGKFKIPTFAHRELDLYRVFWEVQARGGSDLVTAEKLWKEICRSLDLDLRGQTSASFNMRLNYERCLLDFEHYISNGQYLSDLAAHRAPSTDIFQQAVPVKQGPKGATPSGFARPALPSAFPAGPAPQGDFSFTKLLGLGEDGGGGPLQPPPLMGLSQASEQPAVMMPWDVRMAHPASSGPPPSIPGQGSWTASVLGAASAFPSQPPTSAQAPGNAATATPGTSPAEPQPPKDPANVIMAALHAGYTADQLHQMIEQAARGGSAGEGGVPQASAGGPSATPGTSAAPPQNRDWQGAVAAVASAAQQWPPASSAPPGPSAASSASAMARSDTLGTEGAEASASLMMLEGQPPNGVPAATSKPQSEAGAPLRSALSAMAEVAADEANLLPPQPSASHSAAPGPTPTAGATAAASQPAVAGTNEAVSGAANGRAPGEEAASKPKIKIKFSGMS